MNFTDKELLAIKFMIYMLQRQAREDIAGTFLYHGGARILPDDDYKSLLELAKKLEPTLEEQALFNKITDYKGW